MANPESSFPYSNVVGDLLASTMRAQHLLLDAHFKNEDIAEDRFAGEINKHFSWLTLCCREGTNRHLFDAPDGLYPLRTSGLRNKRSIPKHILERLERRLPMEADVSPQSTVNSHSVKAKAIARYWQEGPTRISELIRRAVLEDVAESAVKREKARLSGRSEKFGFSIRSPLQIVYDFLTAPDMPGSRAYALMAVRNFLFAELELAPNLDDSGEGVSSKSETSFGVHAIEEALSQTWTSVRPRYESKGEDKISLGTANAATLVRHFMAVKGVFRFRFDDPKDDKLKSGGGRGKKNCLDYLLKGRLRGVDDIATMKGRRPKEAPAPITFQLERSEFNERLPESGELVNELLGLPLPIRGADTVFRGGLRFAARKGLVVAVHGGPGAGKTSFALALGAYLAPFGIRTLFLSGEEHKSDLEARLSGLIPDGIRRLDFFPENIVGKWVAFLNPREDSFGDVSTRSIVEHNRCLGAEDNDETRHGHLINKLEQFFKDFQDNLISGKNLARPEAEGFSIPKPCKAIVIFDGLHDLFALGAGSGRDADGTLSRSLERLHELVTAARTVEALVILTTGGEWIGNARLDYLVDMSIQLTHRSLDEYGAKPDRRLSLTKARHQLCATGTHGIQIAGAKGLRFSPQINYQLDRRALWKVRLPVKEFRKKVLLKVLDKAEYLDNFQEGVGGEADRISFVECSRAGASIWRNSHVFINGQGSGGKAGLALKIAIAPSFNLKDTNPVAGREKVLVVSFLYPREYYDELLGRLQGRRGGRRDNLDKVGALDLEYTNSERTFKPARIEVIHLYPGHLKPNDLFNRIEWELDSAELCGDPYTCVIIDGIHNVYLQFPEIQRNDLFWPQLYNALRYRQIMTITTHTTLTIPQIIKDGSPQPLIDDGRSIPLRHALVQKTDFQIEVDPNEEIKGGQKDERLKALFRVKVVAAIGQPIPAGHVLWNRENLVFVRDPGLSCDGCEQARSCEMDRDRCANSAAVSASEDVGQG